ncbi:hypothetical protein DPMN_163989 [Dreissena polymorpha]|uniref:Uncharacterized protein n=1 Tax=Dreissena polymorpha TaxID=45954 RepID=A0A9D4EUB9_DREPO|nr:hypothetical protein DPMN_163989 [Dreissena polymorpha]
MRNDDTEMLQQSGDLSKPIQLSPFDCRKEGISWANKYFCHVPDALVDLVFFVGDAEQSSETRVSKGLYSAFCVCVKRQRFATGQ